MGQHPFSSPARHGAADIPPPGAGHVSVPTPGGEVVLVDPGVHRVDVVRRLLDLGVSSRTLLTLLPDWEPLVHAVLTGAPLPQPTPSAST